MRVQAAKALFFTSDNNLDSVPKMEGDKSPGGYCTHAGGTKHTQDNQTTPKQVLARF